jgi:SAM-dependent methyltransferase
MTSFIGRIRRVLQRTFSAIRNGGGSPRDTAPTANARADDYAARIAAEEAIFSQQIEVHDLPEIYHYWSNKYLRTRIETFGFSNPDQFFAWFLERSFRESSQRPARFASVGCGNCDTEIRVARLLIDRGLVDFRIECMDINADMLERGRAAAAESGVANMIVPMQIDFNRWDPAQPYDAVMANQSLHHVVELERLFSAIEKAIGKNGRFITSDMIGRNGHQLWPEARAVLDEFWAQLPLERRYNAQLKRLEKTFQDWDCSVEGFEGIRAQDILPLLIERFDFEFFFGFANIVDPFIGRSFGHHLDANSEEDRAFIDRVHARDDTEILSGRLKPTHIMAVMRGRPFEKLSVWQHLTPEFCVRRCD